MKYFTLAELIRTNRTIPNNPTELDKANIIELVENVLDPLREMYGKPIKVNSGYRSKLVNAAVGGEEDSEHLYGFAADITAGNKTENKKLFKLIRDNFMFRQLINEYNYSWVHVSYNKNDNKKQLKS